MDSTEASRICDAVGRLSLAGAAAEEPEAIPPRPGVELAELAERRLSWYDQLLPFAGQRAACSSDWKAAANCGACLYHLGERKASWDAYRQAAIAARGFERDVTDADMLSDEEVGRFCRQLDREFRADGWVADGAADLAFFGLLARHGRASEVASMAWHELLPNHYFAVMSALCERLTTPRRPMQQVCTDDSRPGFQRGNCIALLATPGAWFVETGGSKRARLDPAVVDVCVRIGVADDTPLGFLVEEVAPAADEI